jgi:hypothetical protein
MMNCSNFNYAERARANIPSAALSYIMQRKLVVPEQYIPRFSHYYHRVWDAKYVLELLSAAPVISKNGVTYAPIFLKGLSLAALREIAANAPTKKVMLSFRALFGDHQPASLSPVVLIIMKKESN